LFLVFGPKMAVKNHLNHIDITVIVAI
jgi:hypothetical protein